LLRAQTPNALCLECHGPERQPKKLEGQPVITIFNGSVKLPEDYFTKNKVVVLPLKFGMGHPVAGHPVSDLLDPADPTKVKTPMSCLTCHQPHSSAQPDLLVKDQANNMAFCSTCHKDLKTR
jgi:predicted CXXCH cytochrome family protein